MKGNLSFKVKSKSFPYFPSEDVLFPQSLQLSLPLVQFLNKQVALCNLTTRWQELFKLSITLTAQNNFRWSQGGAPDKAKRTDQVWVKEAFPKHILIMLASVIFIINLISTLVNLSSLHALSTFKNFFLKKTALIRKEYLKLLMEIQDKHRGSSFVENVFKRKSVGIHRKLAEQRSFQTQKN